MNSEELLVSEPALTEWLEEIKAKLENYRGKKVSLVNSGLTLEEGEYGVDDKIEGTLELNHDGNYKVLVGKMESGKKMYKHFKPELVSLLENPTQTIGIKSLTITIK